MLAVPSTLLTLKVSLTESPSFSSSKAEFAVKVQAPLASIANSPISPVVEEAVKALSALSTSVLVRMPEVVSGALISVSETVADETVAASLLPLMVI